jgi:CRISPR-associated protein (TIGR02584 family)
MNSFTTRKILLAVSGMSPQIVTETLYALVTRVGDPWIPDEIHLLSTHEGCEWARKELLHESRDMFGKFCREYLPHGHGIKFDASCLHAFTRNGDVINDIRDLEDSAVVADAIAAKVWELTQDKNTAIHASIAGGRKSMGFLLGYSMSLYGRPQDRLSHVLVNDGFENNNDFYFKPKKSTIIHGRNNKPLDTDNAVISLAEIPILHLRGKLPKAMQKSPATFAKLIDVMNRSMNEPLIEFDTKAHALKCHGIEVNMSKINFSFYLFVAKKLLNTGPVNIGHDHIKNEDAEEDSKAIYGDEEKMKGFLRDRKSGIKKALDEALGLLGSEQYAITSIDDKCRINIENIVIN